MTKEEFILRVLEMESQESKGIFENVPLFSQDTAMCWGVSMANR